MNPRSVMFFVLCIFSIFGCKNMSTTQSDAKDNTATKTSWGKYENLRNQLMGARPDFSAAMEILDRSKYELVQESIDDSEQVDPATQYKPSLEGEYRTLRALYKNPKTIEWQDIAGNSAIQLWVIYLEKPIRIEMVRLDIDGIIPSN